MNITLTADCIRHLRNKASALIAEADALLAKLRANLGLGKHDGATVYQVSPTRVKAHTRRGYRAVRCR